MLLLLLTLSLFGDSDGQELACPQVLGITNKASIDEIRAAYRREALQWHPDRNMDNPNDRFIAITECYERMKSGTMEDGDIKSSTGNHPSNAQDIFNEFMQGHGGFTFSFNVGGFKMSGTSTTTSTTISGGKKITTTVKKDLGRGTIEKIVVEEDLTTGARRVIQANKDLTEL
jgi:DnaJ-class molecular chaperone